VVREALSAAVAKVVAAAIVEALLLGGAMPPADQTASLPADVQKRIAEYRRCEASFTSRLTKPPGAGDDERAIYARRVGVERAVACLFPGRDAARVAADLALDIDFDREGEFIDTLLRELPVRWLEPYLQLAAGHAKLCGGEADSARRQLSAAAKGGSAIVQTAAEYLLATAAPPCSPSP
jgi:hypothetical protein